MGIGLFALIGIILLLCNRAPKNDCVKSYGNKSYGIKNDNGKFRCACKTWYLLNSKQDECISPTDLCRENLGSDDFYSNWDKITYEWDSIDNVKSVNVMWYICLCNTWLVVDNINRNKCITPTELCQEVDWVNVFGTPNEGTNRISNWYACYCKTWYVRNQSLSKCSRDLSLLKIYDWKTDECHFSLTGEENIYKDCINRHRINIKSLCGSGLNSTELQTCVVNAVSNAISIWWAYLDKVKNYRANTKWAPADNLCKIYLWPNGKRWGHGDTFESSFLEWPFDEKASFYECGCLNNDNICQNKRNKIRDVEDKKTDELVKKIEEIYKQNNAGNSQIPY